MTMVSADSRIRAVRYHGGLRGEWDDFVMNGSRNGTMFHERSFLEYHPPGRYHDASMLLYDEGKNPPRLEGVFPAAVVEDGGKKAVVSHPGSTYGGLVYSRGARARDVKAMIEAVIAQARALGADRLEMRLAETMIYSDPPDQELAFLLWHRGFTRKTAEFGSVAPLGNGPAQVKRTMRWAVERAAREGIRVVGDYSMEEAHRLISANLKERHGKDQPTHSLEELLEIKRRYPDRVTAWAALKDEAITAATVIFEANRRVVHVFYIGQDYRHSAAQPLYLLFDTVIKNYSEAGFRYLNFGISSRGGWIKWGILEFKEGFGARGVMRETLALDGLSLPEPDDGPDAAGRRP